MLRHFYFCDEMSVFDVEKRASVELSFFDDRKSADRTLIRQMSVIIDSVAEWLEALFDISSSRLEVVDSTLTLTGSFIRYLILRLRCRLRIERRELRGVQRLLVLSCHPKLFRRKIPMRRDVVERQRLTYNRNWRDAKKNRGQSRFSVDFPLIESVSTVSR